MLEVFSVEFRYLGLGGNLRHGDSVSFCLGLPTQFRSTGVIALMAPL